MSSEDREKELARITLLTNNDLLKELLRARCGDQRAGHSEEFCHWQFDEMYRVFRTRLLRVGFIQAD